MRRIHLLALVSVVGLSSIVHASTVQVKVENIKEPRGQIFWALHNDKENFLKDGVKPLQGGTVEVTSTDFSFEVSDVPDGEYALIVFQDLDGNKELNTTLFSYPLEPYGFSQNPSIWFGPPSFSKSSFVVGEEETEATALTIKLK